MSVSLILSLLSLLPYDNPVDTLARFPSEEATQQVIEQYERRIDDVTCAFFCDISRKDSCYHEIKRIELALEPWYLLRRAHRPSFQIDWWVESGRDCVRLNTRIQHLRDCIGDNNYFNGTMPFTTQGD